MRAAYLLLILILPLVSCSQEKADGQVVNIKAENKFVTLKFELDKKICEAVINRDYKGFKEKQLFPLSLFIKVKTEDQDEYGHPTEKEAKIFYALQTDIIAEMNDAFSFCHVGTTTMTGYRDILLYIDLAHQKKASDVLSRLKNENPRILSFVFEEDPEWEAVAEFYEAI